MNRRLEAVAAWCCALALAALFAPWHVHLTVAGRAVQSGWSAVPLAAPVAGGLALVLFAWGWRAETGPWAPFGAAPAALAAIVCWASAGADSSEVAQGAAPWIAAFAFATAAACGVLGARRRPG